MAPTNSQERLCLVDSHVHIYPGYDVGVLLDSAAYHFDVAARQMEQSDNYDALLLLSESGPYHWWREAAEHPGRIAAGGWRLASVDAGGGAIVAIDAQGRRVHIVPGRQMATREGLEVLALGTPEVVRDGLSLHETLDRVQALDALAVIPWAVGKWFGRRGALVAECLPVAKSGRVFLGDNAARPLGWRAPAQFTLARELGIPILPGTDPLPWPGQETRVGGYGFAARLSGAGDPVTELKQALQSGAATVSTFGRRVSPVEFLISQIKIRLR